MFDNLIWVIHITFWVSGGHKTAISSQRGNPVSNFYRSQGFIKGAFLDDLDVSQVYLMVAELTLIV